MCICRVHQAEVNRRAWMIMERLFATEKFGGRVLYRFYAFTVAVGICLVLYYRATCIPANSVEGTGQGRAAWLGMLVAELWYSVYWVITQSVRWCPVRRRAIKDRLDARFAPSLACCIPT